MTSRNDEMSRMIYEVLKLDGVGMRMTRALAMMRSLMTAIARKSK
jgi:hypothetical protein